MSEPLRTYTFLPWVRQGLGARIQTVDPIGPNPNVPVERASIAIDFDVNGTRVSNTVQLYGPGDVLGINPRAVVKTEPRNWITNFEPNYFPYIEFYDEDFPWRYTPATAAAGHRLRPWIALVALTEEEFTDAGVVQPSGDRGAPPVPVVEIHGNPARIFPPADQTWAWGHVHASQDVSADGALTLDQAVDGLEELIRRNPDLASARVLCPRKLRENTAYHALVLPAFEIGRRAALGESITGVDNLKPSWGDGQSRYPVLYRWFFRTADRGDFEFLVDLLQPRPVADEVGIRDMDVQAPGFGVRGMTSPPVMGLEGALRKPGAEARPLQWPPSTTPVLLDDLQAKVNLAAELMTDPPAGGHPDPVVTLPLYGRWHAMVDRLDASGDGWVNELNADPRLRTAAGFGTRVLQANQEDYMQRAWRQVGDVIEANRRIRQAQLGLSAGLQILRKNLQPLRDHDLIAVTRPVHARVLGSPTTIREQVRQSRLPDAALEPAFRSLMRPRGPVSKQALPDAGARASDVLPRLNDGRITAAPPKITPAGQIGLEAIAGNIVPDSIPPFLRTLLGQPWMLWAVVAVVILVLFVAVGPLVALTAAAAAAVAAPVVARLSRQVAAAAGLAPDALTAEAVEQTPARPSFVVTDPGAPVSSALGAAGDADSVEARQFRRAAREMNLRVALPEASVPVKEPLDMQNTALKLTMALDPTLVLPARLRGTLGIPADYEPVKPVRTIAPVMAHPHFKDPMYKPLRDLSPELLVPNLNQIPNNTISLMENNGGFIESYMVGVNHEMGRELLWREYPTDQRGSYFRQFWEVADVVSRDPTVTPAEQEEALLDIDPIHQWERTTDLGTHGRPLPTGVEEGDPRLVLVIRGELLKKYPTTVVYAQKAMWSTDPQTGGDIRTLDESNPASNILGPMFKAEVPPDIHFFGFNLTQSQARGGTERTEDPGWFLVLQERPGEPRFGMDVTDVAHPPAVTRWRELTWNHLGDPATLEAVDLASPPESNIPAGSPDQAAVWGSNGAAMAYILLQDPVMVAFHAADMLD